MRALALSDSNSLLQSNEHTFIDRHDLDTVHRLVDQFNLFAFVIHDPEVHRDFHAFLGSVFDFLDYTTGQKLLFFALTDPPSTWHEGAVTRKYYRHLQALQRGYSEGIFENPDTTNDPSTSAFAIATALDIRYEDLPVIVVTNNLSANRFTWFKTSETCLKGQLTELGFLADRNEDIRRDWGRAEEVFNDFRNRLDPCNAFENKKLTISLAKTLSDVLALMSISKDNNSNEYPIAKRQAVAAVKRLDSDIRAYRERFAQEDDMNEAFETLLVRLATYLAVSNRQPLDAIPQLVHIDGANLEDESRLMIRTAQIVNNLFERQDPFIMESFGEPQNYDYASVGICLAKVFELELNLSVVHWMRRALGIPMPTYFNKHDAARDAVTYTPANLGLQKPFPINFNKRHQPTSNWIAPGIGQSLLCYDSMLLNPDFNDVPNFGGGNNRQALQERWRQIGDIRNSIAHARATDRSLVEQLIGHLNVLNQNGVFAITANLKDTMRRYG